MKKQNNNYIWEESDDNLLMKVYDGTAESVRPLANELDVPVGIILDHVNVLVYHNKTHYLADGFLKRVYDLAFVQSHVREGWALNPNEKVVNGIIKGLKRCGGECPCANDGEDKMCPCSNYRLHNKCCCSLYVRED